MMAAHGLVVDNFAGGGGASTGIEAALGRPVDYAINHDPDAVAMHAANHPDTVHLAEDVFRVSPRDLCAGRPVDLAWFSPDCKHFSKAKGGKPVSKNVRGLAWVAIRWAKEVRPRVICLENVEEFRTWGPLLGDRPCPNRKGQTFLKWVAALEACGYRVEHRVLRACDYGAPTIRKRLFLAARCDGQPIHWPQPTHGPAGSGLLPYRTAVEVIDWSIPCPSIFDRKKPLAENTLRRIFRGLQRFVLDTQILELFDDSNGSVRGTHSAWTHGSEARRYDLEDRQTGQFAASFQYHTKESREQEQGRLSAGEDGLDGQNVSAECTSSVISLSQRRTGREHGDQSHRRRQGQQPPAQLGTDHLRGKPRTRIQDQLEKACCGKVLDHPTQECCFLVKYHGAEKDGFDLRDPLHTIPTRDRFGLVTVHGEDYRIVDIGLRMLQPHELAAAQGFPPSYILTGTKTSQVARIGNSVCPPVAEAIVRANLVDPRICQMQIHPEHKEAV